MEQESKLFPFYAGSPETPAAESPAVLKTLPRDRKREVAAYIADRGLVAAVNVALLLNQPLLLTGEPGTGKTQLAYSLGRELGYEILKYETKSTSTARDLFYTYDTLRHFHDAQLKITRDDTDYVTYNALGSAIIRSDEVKKNEKWLPASFERGGPHPYPKDGTIFRNDEGRLPIQEDPEYYREYTVKTRGVTGRGTRRVVVGKGGEIYYSPDHYQSFIRINLM